MLPVTTSWWRSIRSILPDVSGLRSQIAGRFFGSLLSALFIGALALVGAQQLIAYWADQWSPVTYVRDYLHSFRVKPMPEGTFNILIADLHRDDADGTSADSIRQSLDTQLGSADPKSGIRVMRAMRTLRLSQDGDSATALAQAEKQGQAVIKRLGGDVLVWGEVVRVNGMQPVLRLRLVLKDGSGGGGRTVGYALTPALELWTSVQSVPEPGLALLTAGRRDVGFDAGLPVPVAFVPAGTRQPVAADPAWRITALNDQHAYLQFGGDAKVQPRVGDRVGLGISHPCTTFDKWHWMPIVDDDYTVVDAITIHF